MNADIVRDQPDAAVRPDGAPGPLRLTPPERRADRPADRRADRSGSGGPGRSGSAGRTPGRGHHPPVRPNPHPHPHPAARPRPTRRRRGRRSAGASILAVLALVACVVTIVVLANQSTTAQLEHEIASLTTRLNADNAKLGRLQATVAGAAADGSSVTRAVRRLGGGVAGLERTVHGLQIRSNVSQELMLGLRDCVAQLQQNFAGLTLQTSSAHGHVTRVGLTDSALLPSSCGPAQPVSGP